MNHIDLKYCGILSTRLQRFQVKQHNPYKANFRCHCCGDSKKSQSITRGWLLDQSNNSGNAWYYCFNCSASMSLGNFLKEYFPPLFNEYVTDKILDKTSGSKKVDLTHNETRIEEPDKPLDKLTLARPAYLKNKSPLQQIRKVSSLKVNHPVKRWLDRRQIPANKHHRMYFAPKFNRWSNTIIPDKLSEYHDEGRLVLPFIDQYGIMFGYAGRSFLPDSEFRYLTMMVDQAKSKVYGLEALDPEQPYYVVEGQIDSLFLNNAIAMAGGSLNLSSLENLDNAVFVLDNEPRNKEIVRRMEHLVADGLKIVVWPRNIPPGYDINDLIVKQGMSRADVEATLMMGQTSGLDAKLKISNWKRT